MSLSLYGPSMNVPINSKNTGIRETKTDSIREGREPSTKALTAGISSIGFNQLKFSSRELREVRPCTKVTGIKKNRIRNPINKNVMMPRVCNSLLLYAPKLPQCAFSAVGAGTTVKSLAVTAESKPFVRPAALEETAFPAVMDTCLAERVNDSPEACAASSPVMSSPWLPSSPSTASALTATVLSSIVLSSGSLAGLDGSTSP
mmetsp:Transcript_12253/g.44694  ORF Transcript_12253/g.44694 Transcript_12253/m.44694 type:complete len:203 (-) Transcript_12253:1386-1994(-)